MTDLHKMDEELSQLAERHAGDDRRQLIDTCLIAIRRTPVFNTTMTVFDCLDQHCQAVVTDIENWLDTDVVSPTLPPAIPANKVFSIWQRRRVPNANEAVQFDPGYKCVESLAMIVNFINVQYALYNTLAGIIRVATHACRANAERQYADSTGRDLPQSVTGASPSEEVAIRRSYSDTGHAHSLALSYLVRAFDRNEN